MKVKSWSPPLTSLSTATGKRQVKAHSGHSCLIWWVLTDETGMAASYILACDTMADAKALDTLFYITFHLSNNISDQNSIPHQNRQPSHFFQKINSSSQQKHFPYSSELSLLQKKEEDTKAKVKKYNKFWNMKCPIPSRRESIAPLQCFLEKAISMITYYA